MSRGALAAGVVLAFAGTPAMPAAAAPLLDQLVVFRSGDAKLQTVRSTKTKVKAGGRRCGVPGSTPLAALVRSRLPKLLLKDFSDVCDPSSLFVEAIGKDRNRGESGWVYKVGNRQGTTAASDLSGPFGSGRLKRRARVTWFYCVFERGGCQRTLGLRPRDEGGGAVSVRVTAYDDEGRGKSLAGANVVSAGVSAKTDSRGLATLDLGPGKHTLRASKNGHVRSFDERITLG